MSILAFTFTGCASWSTDKDDTKDWSPQRLYNAAKSALANKDYEQAIKYYESIEARYPYGPFAEQAQIEVAYAYYKSEEPASAVAAADRFIRLHPTHPNVDYVYYLKGLANFNDRRGLLDRFGGDPDLSDRDPKAAREAFNTFRELATRFPDSKYAADARARMAYLLNALAKHDVLVAKYYVRRGAYVAAVNRCQYVVEHYQRTPAVEDALGVMLEAYTRMGMADLAHDTQRVLEKNFPGSRYLVADKRGALMN